MPIADIAAAAVSMAEAQAYARVETGEEEALLAGLVRTASALCETFVGQVLVARPFEEYLPASAQWQRLSVTPIRSIETVSVVASNGSVQVLAADAFQIDVDSRGDGWVRLVGQNCSRIIVQGQAGLATDANDIPEPLRQGILRLVAHLYATRDGSGGEPPAAVTALWRPYRRMRLT